MASKKKATVSFTDQLRNAVKECGTTHYALARQLGISQSTLSRFLSGERGLTLNVVDKLADVIGLQIIVTVEKTNRPKRRGPKPRKEKKMEHQQLEDWEEIEEKRAWEGTAYLLAWDACENNFSSWRGVWYSEEVGKICIYNNHPYREPGRREEETNTFRRWLKANNIKELAYATYPETGEDAGYTYAMILDAGIDQIDDVTDELRRILGSWWM